MYLRARRAERAQVLTGIRKGELIYTYIHTYIYMNTYAYIYIYIYIHLLFI